MGGNRSQSSSRCCRRDPPVRADVAAPARRRGPRRGGPAVRAPLGRVAGARSGDKGGNANLGVWARTDAGVRVAGWFPQCRDAEIAAAGDRAAAGERYELPNLRALNFVIPGLLGEGVAASARLDPQAKSLGEWLRARIVDIPPELMP